MDQSTVCPYCNNDRDIRYDCFTFQTYLNASHFQQCRAPGCSSGQQFSPENDSFIICRDCEGRTCVRCDVVWHAGETCNDYEIKKKAEEEKGRQTEEKASLRYLRKKTKKCPGCGAPTVKIDGCDHITCKLQDNKPKHLDLRV